MPKKTTKNKELPNPRSLDLNVQGIIQEKINEQAIRRGKVKQLMNMGYDSKQIFAAIENRGIKVDNKMIKIKCSVNLIRNDMDYIIQEDLSVEETKDIQSKKAIILNKYTFLYQQAIKQYYNHNNKYDAKVRNNYLNTALTVLDKISHLEGLKYLERISGNIQQSETNVFNVALNFQKLNRNDQREILSTIQEVLTKRQPKTIKGYDIPGESSLLPTPTSNNEGIPRKS